MFGVATIFVNLTNTYDKPKAEPEMVKLAQFAKHHVPEDHPKDTEDFVNQRVEMLVKEGATGACVAISKTESLQSRELLARYSPTTKVVQVMGRPEFREKNR